MTKSVPSPSRRPSVGHPSSSSLSVPSPMPNELRNSSNSENCPIRASFDGPINFEVKHRHNQSIDLSSSLSLFSMPKIPFNNSRQMPICAQCSRVIVDPFILHVQPNLEFHSDCLKCSECGRPLDEHCSAFVRDGKTKFIVKLGMIGRDFKINIFARKNLTKLDDYCYYRDLLKNYRNAFSSIVCFYESDQKVSVGSAAHRLWWVAGDLDQMAFDHFG
ncbi:hypothetical protein niasHT_035136 [Heterodera trifolii]|uniref:LIM zinc-binding domain-containing protein n=1 Tax=Heterodera trifolii TaxID=157864 RepID=A0ABD2J2Z2_9BILA